MSRRFHQRLQLIETIKLQEEQRAAEQEQKERMAAQRKAANKAYVAPSVEMLHSSISKADSGDVEANKKLIQSTLENSVLT